MNGNVFSSGRRRLNYIIYTPEGIYIFQSYNASGMPSQNFERIEKRAATGSHPKMRCYIVEEVGGKTIYTSWDKEEAFQLADQLLISGKETRNNLAVRRVSCSLIPPPMTESGKTMTLNEGKSIIIDSSAPLSCPKNTFPAIGYCIEKFELSNSADIGSFVRRKMGDHFVVSVGDRGTWNPIREKYYGTPHVYEIWHPRNEQNCSIKLKPKIKDSQVGN